jgi:cholesterol transport system auxiliary component
VSRAGALLPALLACLALAACSGLFRSTAKPEQVYYLRAPGPAATSTAPSGSASVRVARADGGPGLDTTHIMLVQADHRMNFYNGTRWPVPAPQLVEALTVQTLRASGQWASVEDAGSAFPSDYLLQMHLRRFEADYTEAAGAPMVHVVIDCLFGRRRGGREIVAALSVSGSSAAAANHQAEVVAAFEQATGTALQALSQQLAQAVSADLQRPDAPREGESPSG